MTMREAVARNITRVRVPQWAFPDAYMRIDVIGGRVGPWLHLFARREQEATGEPTPQDIPSWDTIGRLYFENDRWEEYTGPIDPSDTAHE